MPAAKKKSAVKTVSKKVEEKLGFVESPLIQLQKVNVIDLTNHTIVGKAIIIDHLHNLGYLDNHGNSLLRNADNIDEVEMLKLNHTNRLAQFVFDASAMEPTDKICVPSINNSVVTFPTLYSTIPDTIVQNGVFYKRIM